MEKPVIALGADHGGFEAKCRLIAYLKDKGHRVLDVGAPNAEASDYPIFGFRVAEAVAQGRAEVGVLLCRSGNGMAMAANRVVGVRAAIATNGELARLARAHNEANVLVMGSDFMEEPAIEVLQAFLDAEPERGRHGRRVGIIKHYDATLASPLPTHRLAVLGQSPWLDDISDVLFASGRLKELINEQGVRGLTSNPSIFEKAINSGEGRYASELAEMRERGVGAEEAYEKLTTDDIKQAADLLLPLHERTGGDDGFVSLEVLPEYACDEETTFTEARRLSRLVDRPNLLIKVPATAEGIRAFRRLTAHGVNVNVTLIFSRDCYNNVARAYVAGLRDRLEKGEDVASVRSVASVFVSRVDTAVDKILEELRQNDPEPAKLALIDRLLHTAAIDNTRLIYQDFEGIFGGEEFAELGAAGAAPQRPLWGSTSTKNPSLPDTLYVDELIGAQSVNTIPLATLEAFIDHGRVRGLTIGKDIEGARERLDKLAGLGIDLTAVCDKLQVDGIKSFADAFDTLFESIKAALSKEKVGTAG